MINTLKRATKLAPLLAVAAILATAAPAFAQAPSQAQRDAIKSAVPLRLHGALLQRAAGRRGLAAMPAEEHVEPLIELPERGARRRSAGGCDAPSRPTPRRRKPPRPRLQRAAAPKAAEPKAAAAARRGTAEQRADFRHPQRMPLRLSKGLRGRADRRRAGAAMPGKEQGQTLGRLREGRLRRQRRWRSSAAAGAAPAAAGAAAAAPAAPTVIVLRPMRPREELFVLRSACGADVRSICGGVAPGGGRIVQCLATNAAQLSPACKDVLSQFAAR